MTKNTRRTFVGVSRNSINTAHNGPQYPVGCVKDTQYVPSKIYFLLNQVQALKNRIPCTRTQRFLKRCGGREYWESLKSKLRFRA